MDPLNTFIEVNFSRNGAAELLRLLNREIINLNEEVSDTSRFRTPTMKLTILNKIDALSFVRRDILAAQSRQHSDNKMGYPSKY